MLTKTDLKEIQKIVKTATKKVVREEIEAEIEVLKDELQADIKMSQIRVQGDLRELKDRIKNLEIAIRKLRKDVKTTSDFLDKEGLRLSKRVGRIEKRLHLEPTTA
jgi:hypothetical protein